MRVQDRGERVARMKAAIGQAVAIAPEFFRGEIDADRMTHTMIDAVRGYAEYEQEISASAPPDAEVEYLREVLAELQACGSGYLAGRCDAACVGRTMTWMVRTFGEH